MVQEYSSTIELWSIIRLNSYKNFVSPKQRFLATFEALEALQTNILPNK
jgi:hypothetical protein